MRTIICFLISILFAAGLKAQVPLKISNEDGAIGFIQNDPKLYFAKDNSVYIAWSDTREGPSRFFAQKYDSAGNNIAGNFKIFSNMALVENDNSLLFCLKERNYPDDFTGGGSTITYGAIYKDLTPVNIDFPFYNYSYGWCGTGFTGKEDILLPANNGFLFFGRYDYNTTLVRIAVSGEILNTKFGLYSYDDERIVYSVDMARYNDSLNIAGWFEHTSYDSLQGPIYGLLNQDDSIVVTYNINQGVDFNMQPYGFDYVHLLKIMLLPKNRIGLWVLNKLNNTLYWYTLDGIGQPARVDSLYLEFQTEYSRSDNIHFTNIRDEQFYIFFREDGYHKSNFHYYGYQFNSDGTFSGNSIHDSSNVSIINQNIKYDGDNAFLSTAVSGDDIYLYQMTDLEKTDSLKVNKDLPNSNERQSQVFKYDDESFFVTWKNGQKYFGRRVNTNGAADQKVITLSAPQVRFGKDGVINFWDNGIHFMDTDFNILNSFLIDNENYQKKLTAELLNDSLVIVAYAQRDTLNLRKYSIHGSLLKERTIINKVNSNMGLKIFTNNDGSFWLCTYYTRLQKIGGDLQSLSDEVDLTVQPLLKFNDDIFFGYSTYYSDFYSSYYGYLLNSENDTLQYFNSLAPYDSKFNFHKINENSFIMMRAEKNEILGKVFFTDGSSKQQFKIYQAADSISCIDAAFGRVDNNILYSWSDNHIKDEGYSVFGRIADVRTITSTGDEIHLEPAFFQLGNAYPNPFNPSTNIGYSLSQPAYVNLKIYNTLGQEVAALVNSRQNGGNYTVHFAANDLSSGLYFYRLLIRTDHKQFVDTKKMLLVR